jgi:hypothetical protein
VSYFPRLIAGADIFALVSLDFLRYVGDGGILKSLPMHWTRWDSAADYIASLTSASSLHNSLSTFRVAKAHFFQASKLERADVHFGRGFAFRRSRRRTPRPPPFSSMKTTPAVSNALRMAISLAAVSAVSGSESSARRMVFMPKARRHSVALHARYSM